MSEINKNDIISQEALDVVAEMRKRVKELQEALILAMGAGRQLNDGLGDQTKLSAMAAELRKLQANIVSLTVSTSNLEAAKKALSECTTQLTTATKNETAATTTNKRAKSDESNEDKKATAAKRISTQETTKKANATRDEAKAIKDSATLLRAQTSLTNAQTAATKAAKNATDANTNANKGAGESHKTLAGSFKSLITAAWQLAGAYLTIQGAIAIFKKFRDATKDLDSLRFAMQATIKSTFELSQTQYYLLDISKKYGLDIVNITNSYLKFRAAVNESNMTIDQGQKVFASMAKSSAVLGMSIDKTNDIFLALEQMVGKGGVMSEELRRQMGQHLPVAVTAMAMAAKRAGISMSGSVAELMGLMKAGKVIASEVLPYFGEEVEKQLGIKAVNAVQTLATAQANLTLAWMEFVKAMDKAPILTKIYQTIGNSVQWMANIMKSSKQTISEGASSIVNDVNAKLVQGTNEKEKQVILDAELARLAARKAELEAGGPQQINGVPVETIQRKPSVAQIIARQTWQTLGGSTERFDATFDKAPTPLAKYINEAEAITEAQKLINDNYADLIKMKEKHPLMADAKSAKKAADDALKLFKEKQAEELAIFTQGQEELRMKSYDEAVMSGADEWALKQKDAELDMNQQENIYNFSIGLNKKLQAYLGHNSDYFITMQQKELVAFQGTAEEKAAFIIKQDEDLKTHREANSLDLAQAQTAEAQLTRDIKHKTVEYNISETMREFEAEKRMERDKVETAKRDQERWKDEDIAKIETGVTTKVLGLTNALPKGPIKDQSAYGLVESKYNIDVLKAQEQGLIELLGVKNLTVNEEKDMMLKLDGTRKALAEAERADVQKTYEYKKEQTAKAFKYGIQAMNDTFSIFTGLQDAQMQRVEWQHDREVNLAGDNTAKKIAAENRYALEKNKIEKRQFILQKAQTAANIVMNTAEAVMATLGETGFFGLPLTPIIIGLGALELASVLAQTIPAFEEGGRHSGGLARMSEKGPELFIPDITGKPMLTPRDETVAIMPAGKFIPNDETQRLLAQSAMNNFMYTDMSPTNSLLRTMVAKEEVQYVDGYKITKTGRYATRS